MALALVCMLNLTISSHALSTKQPYCIPALLHSDPVQLNPSSPAASSQSSELSIVGLSLVQAVLGAINVKGVSAEAFAGQLCGSVVAAVVVVVVVVGFMRYLK